jgi:hypothetical protein
MRNPVAWLATFSVLAIIGLATWSLTRGQAPAGGSPPTRPPVSGNPEAKTPASTPKLAGPTDTDTVEPKADAAPSVDKKSRDPAEQNPLLEQIQITAHRGADWLFRMNGVDGHFATGQIPALNATLEGDHFLRQAGAALALARAARMTGDQNYADRATHSILVLLGDTVVDPKDKSLRFTALPSAVVNRVAGAGMLVQAIHELPSPKQDVLDAAEQLCNFIRKQQRGDGSICLSDSEDSKKAEEGDDASPYPAFALAGLMRSQQRRPADWKSDVVRKALAYYAPLLKLQKNPETVAAHAAAYGEAFLLTKEAPFANCVFDLNDWVCDLQYDRLDARHPDWWGGFMGWHDGKAVAAAPSAEGAVLAEALAEGCRAAKQAGDAQRGERYRGALELQLQYLTRLQYTQANTRHFAEWYRPKVLGGFHLSSLDGNLRLDDARHAVCALTQYVLTVAK